MWLSRLQIIRARWCLAVLASLTLFSTILVRVMLTSSIQFSSGSCSFDDRLNVSAESNESEKTVIFSLCTLCLWQWCTLFLLEHCWHTRPATEEAMSHSVRPLIHGTVSKSTTGTDNEGPRSLLSSHYRHGKPFCFIQCMASQLFLANAAG